MLADPPPAVGNGLASLDAGPFLCGLLLQARTAAATRSFDYIGEYLEDPWQRTPVLD